jgi:hypothetical protein
VEKSGEKTESAVKISSFPVKSEDIRHSMSEIVKTMIGGVSWIFGNFKWLPSTAFLGGSKKRTSPL